MADPQRDVNGDAYLHAQCDTCGFTGEVLAHWSGNLAPNTDVQVEWECLVCDHWNEQQIPGEELEGTL